MLQHKPVQMKVDTQGGGSDRRVKRILVTEDNPINRDLLKSILEKLGYSVEEASNGREALDIMKRDTIDLVLMDIQMPIMDGEETISRIRNDPNLKEIPIIVISAHAMRGDEKKYIEIGSNDYISKPIDKQLSHEKIVRYVG